MAKTIKDTDYLVISARVKALETGLLTAEAVEQILDAKSGEDAGKLLQEWGYPQLDPRRPEAMDAALSAVREAPWPTWRRERRTPGISISSK